MGCLLGTLKWVGRIIVGLFVGLVLGAGALFMGLLFVTSPFAFFIGPGLWFGIQNHSVGMGFVAGLVMLIVEVILVTAVGIELTLRAGRLVWMIIVAYCRASADVVKSFFK